MTPSEVNGNGPLNWLSKSVMSCCWSMIARFACCCAALIDAGLRLVVPDAVAADPRGQVVVADAVLDQVAGDRRARVPVPGRRAAAGTARPARGACTETSTPFATAVLPGGDRVVEVVGRLGASGGR